MGSPVEVNFLDKIASSDPVPAGGAAAAHGACLAVGIINKLVRIKIERRINELLENDEARFKKLITQWA